MSAPIPRARSAAQTAPIESPDTNGFSRRRNATRTWSSRKPTVGLSCFFMPRRLPTALNGIYIQRLKDKLGNRSNASSEVEFVDAWAHCWARKAAASRPSRNGHLHAPRLLAGSAGMMRQAVVQALHHAHHRKAFGALLIEQP